jgi:hypothetical protein
MRKQGILWAAAAVLLAAAILTAVTAAASLPDLTWRLIGGGSPVRAGGVTLSGGVGQAVSGIVETGATSLCSGFWCAPPGRRVHLPEVLK